VTTVRIAQPAGDREFLRLAEPFRRELLGHCYRMLGSVHDAEDAVQETYLRAWRGYDRFEGRSSLRGWLYRIATNVCLRAVERTGRRPMPSGLGEPAGVPTAALDAPTDVAWLQPLPTDPADAVVAREGVRLAFVAALQLLPARQRAVLVLRDVLRLPAAEVARMLGTSTVAVNGALRRARDRLERAAPAAATVTEPTDPAVRVLLDRYVAAFHAADLTALGQVLRDDVALEMPPYATWFFGRPAVLAFLGARVLDGPSRFRLVGTSANGQPAVAAYRRGPGDAPDTYHAHALHVLAVTAAGVGAIAAFLNREVFELFGLPPVIPGTGADLFS
jgi:RNA polymerase sigma-70 factor (ECF subfamily)